MGIISHCSDGYDKDVGIFDPFGARLINYNVSKVPTAKK